MTKLTGFDETAATWGGPGLLSRKTSHAEECAAGRIWHPCGYRSEVAPLRSVLLSVPGEEFLAIDDPDAWLMLAPIDLPRLLDQHCRIVEFYKEQGVEVLLVRGDNPPPNLIFMRDTFAMTPEGGVVARLAPAQRAGEERWAALGLAQAGISILRTLRGNANFEGADALWLNERKVLVGVGRRTNSEGFHQYAAVLHEIDPAIEVTPIPMPEGVQHLLGMLNFIDANLGAVDREKAPEMLIQLLREEGLELLIFEADDELRVKRGMNFVTLGPRRLVMPAECPAMRARFEARGVEVFELEVDEYLKAGGGLACLTGIVARSD